ncbi:cytochrome P450 [Diaporthe sp. PMI_573]|nr:cytochrome P450 [Diaporthaceae sp. PMI_573]
MLTRLFFAAVALLVPYLYRTMRFKRLQQFARFPQLPPSVFLGYLQAVDDFVKRSASGAHPDVAFTAIHETLGCPPVMFVDLRPVASPMLVVASYKVAEQISKSLDEFPYSPPKVPEIWNYMVYLNGPTSIASFQGEEWRVLCKRFNLGFALQYLLSLMPAIVHKAFIFVDRLSGLAQSGNDFSLQRLAIDLTLDVIGDLVLDTNMQIDLPWWFMPRLEWKRSPLALQVRSLRKAIVQDSYSRRNVGADRPRSILSMSLEDIDILLPKLLETILCTKLDEIFGLDPSLAAVALRLLAPGGEELVNCLTYTSAVIWETLYLWPPGATLRITRPANMFVSERWLWDSAADTIPAGAFWAFERGPRNCAGQELATIEARVVMALVARYFYFSKVGIGAAILDSQGSNF